MQCGFKAATEIVSVGQVGQLDSDEVFEDPFGFEGIRVTLLPLGGTGSQVVHREHQGAVSGVLGAADQYLRKFPVFKEIKLEPQRCGGYLRHLLDTVAGRRAEAEDSPCYTRGPGGRQLTFGMGPLVGPSGRQHDREADLISQYFGGQVPLADVGQYPRAQFHPVHRLQVIGV